MNLLLIGGKIPEFLFESKIILIPKKEEASNPGDFRPITVSSVLVRTFHKILVNRLAKAITLDGRQRAFLPRDGTARNIFDLNMILRYHRQYYKPLYLSSINLTKAFDFVSHNTIRDTLAYSLRCPNFTNQIHF